MKKSFVAIVFMLQLIVFLQVAYAFSQRQINNWNLVPAVPYIGWCAPTTKAMIFGFWDNAYPEMGYGRLVHFWYDHPFYKVNVPSIVSIMFDRNTGKGINKNAPVLVRAINQSCRYHFNLLESNSNESNNWNWELLKGEINANRPILWAFNLNNNRETRHVVVGIGYRELPDRNTVIVLDSNGPSDITKRIKEYDHFLSYKVECYIPRGGTTGSNLRLLSPTGGERIVSNQYNQIVWYVWGSLITRVTIMYSLDGGSNWYPIARNYPAHQGQNIYNWVPNYITQRARIWVTGYSSYGDFVASDGSRRNFTFQIK